MRRFGCSLEFSCRSITYPAEFAKTRSQFGGKVRLVMPLLVTELDIQFFIVHVGCRKRSQLLLSEKLYERRARQDYTQGALRWLSGML